MQPDTTPDALRLMIAVDRLLDAPGRVISHWESDEDDPESWTCNLCARDWETRRHEPEAHADDCPLREVYAALSALQAPAPVVVPEGWMLQPRYGNPLAAEWSLLHEHEREAIRAEVLRAMLSAAPPAPVAVPEGWTGTLRSVELSEDRRTVATIVMDAPSPSWVTFGAVWSQQAIEIRPRLSAAPPAPAPSDPDPDGIHEYEAQLGLDQLQAEVDGLTAERDRLRAEIDEAHALVSSGLQRVLNRVDLPGEAGSQLRREFTDAVGMIHRALDMLRPAALPDEPFEGRS